MDWEITATVHLVDIWNMIEAFRENGMNAMPVHSQVFIFCACICVGQNLAPRAPVDDDFPQSQQAVSRLTGSNFLKCAEYLA